MRKVLFCLFSVLLMLPACAGMVRLGETPVEWKLPVPKAISGGPADLQGVLVLVGGERHQTVDFGLQQSATGGIGLAWLKGYRDDGTYIELERTLCDGGKPLGFTSVALAADETGMLVAGLIRGKETVDLAVLEERCGISRSEQCIQDNCMGICGMAPTCGCWSPITGEAAPGGCIVLNRTWCSGSCDQNRRCNTQVNSCGCEDLPTGGQAPQGASQLQRNTREPE